jgi:O-antigen/teichoic acid export membrane protein
MTPGSARQAEVPPDLPEPGIDRDSLLQRIWRSNLARHGIILTSAMVLTGALDYAVNLVVGRWLEPVEFGVFISVMAVVQLVTLLGISIRMVVAFHVAEITAGTDFWPGIADFVQGAWRWAWRWGAIATAVGALATPLIASALMLPAYAPLLAVAPLLLLLFLRETAFGALQGIQAFGRLGAAQVVQAVLRLGLTFVLLWMVRGVTWAVMAQPLAAVACIALTLWWLQPQFMYPSDARLRTVSWPYAVSTVLGLGVFGLMSNADALLVRRLFDGRVAGDYGPVVTLAKISLFLPWAIGLVIFPKVARRRASGRDARPLLLFGLGAALAPGLALTGIYLVVPGGLVTLLFGAAYADPGIVLALASLAATLFAGVHIWINYALSLERKGYIYVLAVLVLWQFAGMLIIGRRGLVPMVLVNLAASLAGNVAGYLTTRSPSPLTAGERSSSLR